MASNNTFKHISDKSIYTEFDPNGTKYPQNVTNVQQALAMTSPTSNATENEFGVIKIASIQETLDGTDNAKAVTPFTLAQRLRYPEATVTQAGIIQIATNAEALAGTIGNKAIVPSSLITTINSYFTNKNATETENGVIKLSTQPAAIAGVDNTTAMTPLRVKEAIAEATKLIPSYSTATEDNAGLVQLATAGQIQQGTLRAGFAISPFGLAQLTGNQSRRGIVQAATMVQANAGDDDSLYISARGFKTYNGTETNFGTVKITDVPGNGGAGTALSTNAQVVRLNAPRQDVTGTLNVNGQILQNNSPLVSEKNINDHMPIGSIIMWVSDVLPSGNWEVCDGGSKSKTAHPELFRILGYKYGGDLADSFAKPDMQGLFFRGANVGRDILRERGVDAKNKPKLGNDVSGGRVGEVQKQQLIRHKHIMAWGETYGEPWFGETRNRKGIGSGKSDGSNPWFFTNDGDEIEDANIRGEKNTVNSEGLMGSENRPWNMSGHYIIKVK